MIDLYLHFSSFLQVINKVAQGIADDHTVNYLSNIANKPQAALSLAPSTTVLFATNKECEEYNMECLLKVIWFIYKPQLFHQYDLHLTIHKEITHLKITDIVTY